jgi:hypothetical protein
MIYGTGKKIVSLINLSKVFITLILPFTYIINIYAFFLLLTLLVGILLFDKGKLIDKMLVFYIFSFQFSAIIIAGVHYYDVALMIISVYILAYKKGIIRILNGDGIAALFCAVLFIFFINPSDLAVDEIIRYGAAFLTFLAILNLDSDYIYLKKNISYLLCACVYFALIVFFLYTTGRLQNYEGGIIISDMFLYTDEIRLNGFFTDPNKYLIYVSSVLCIGSFLGLSRFNLMLGILGMIISMSRTSLISIIIYFMILLMQRINKRMNFQSKVIFDVVVTLCVCSVLYIITQTRIANDLFVTIGMILGREQSVQSTSITTDNRTVIWEYAFSLIPNSPIWGYGLNIISDKTFFEYGTHNTFIGLIVQGGGILIFAYLFFFRFFRRHLSPAIIAFLIIPLFVLDLSSYRMYFVVYAIFLNLLHRKLFS